MTRFEYILLTIGLCFISGSYGYSIAPVRVITKEIPVCERLPMKMKIVTAISDRELK